MPSQNDWAHRWKEGDTPWDLGGPTPALLEFTTHLPSQARVLVPGCGAGHDAHLLWKMGFRVTAVDFVDEALEQAKTLHPHSGVKWKKADILSLHLNTKFDAIWEYTCFCAMEPSERPNYLARLAAHLLPRALYGGLVFCEVPIEAGPPFAVSQQELHALLHPHFEVIDWVSPYQGSVKPRQGTESWFLAARS